MLFKNITINHNNKASVMSQFPEPGTKVSKGSTVEVNFQMYDGATRFNPKNILQRGFNYEMRLYFKKHKQY